MLLIRRLTSKVPSVRFKPILFRGVNELGLPDLGDPRPDSVRGARSLQARWMVLSRQVGGGGVPRGGSATSLTPLPALKHKSDFSHSKKTKKDTLCPS